MSLVRHPKDFYSGLIFIALGTAAIVIASNYALGTMLTATALWLSLIGLPNLRRKREEVFEEGEN
jgi:hypothetical protein